jgi:hypothetical protein
LALKRCAGIASPIFEKIEKRQFLSLSLAIIISIVNQQTVGDFETMADDDGDDVVSKPQRNTGGDGAALVILSFDCCFCDLSNSFTFVGTFVCHVGKCSGKIENS